MSGFDLRDHLPFFLAMDLFDDSPQIPTIPEDLLQNLQNFIMENFYEYSDEYKNALDDLIKTFNIKSLPEDAELISIKIV